VLEQERKLVEAAKSDPREFSALYDMYFDRIYKYVWRRCNDKDTAHDLVSQTFYDALAHLKDYEWRGYSFSCWLYKIAHNNFLKWYREQSRIKAVDLEEGAKMADARVNTVQAAIDNESRTEIQEILNKLEPEEREIIRLKFFEEVSNIEIAEIMGLSANHIGVKVFRALKKVKQLLSHTL